MKAKHLFHVLLTSVMLAATAGLTAACTSNDDNPATPSGPSESVIKEKIVGKWKGATQDGTELTTNGRTVLTFKVHNRVGSAVHFRRAAYGMLLLLSSAQ